MDRLVGTLAVALMLSGTALSAQVVSRDSSPDTTTVIPGPHYRAGWFHRLFLGDHYRQLWTQPIRVPVLDLSRFAGGLTPMCRGGGLQTKSLRFRDADRRQYVFRSVDKDPTAKLPVLLRETFVADVLQDQVSSHHPAGALVVAPLLEAAGVLHVDPHLTLMPDDSRLGQFRPSYAGMLGLMEERPTDGPGGTPGFGHSREIKGTEHVWDKIEDTPSHRVDAEAFLTARLMDVFVGDWDRHYDQWRWARYRKGDEYVWRPIPRDRDQAFARLDGLILDLARYYIPELVSFDESYGSVFGLTWTARALDRRFLAELDKPTWDSIVTSLQSRLTDSVIDHSVRRLPTEIYEGNGAELASALKKRRARLQSAADRFYAVLAEYVDIHATDTDEYAEIVRLDDARVRVRLYRVDESETRTKGMVGHPYFERTFDRAETNEVRLYLHGGDDRAVVRGHVGRSILIRVIGGGGDDILVDSSQVANAVRTRFYDARGENRFQRGLQTSLDRTRFRPPPRPDDEPEPRGPGACGDSIVELPPRNLALPFQDWGRRWFPAPWINFQPDLGLFVESGADRFGYGFRRVPYKSHQLFRAGFATGPRRFRLAYTGDFRGLSRHVDALVALRYSGIDIIRFHGFGNETELDLPDAFYKVTLRQVTLAPSLALGRSPTFRLAIGPRFKYVATDLGAGNLIDSLRPYGVGGVVQLGVQADLVADTRDVPAAATRGVHFKVGGTAFPAWLDLTSSYASVYGEIASYISASRIPTRPTLAVRAGGKKVWGTFPFYDAAFLGGANDLRGYSEQRFAGDAALYGNGELRLFVARYRLLLPGEFGVFGLADVGRVFLNGESSNDWHAAGGGGIWFAYIDRAATMSVAIAQSRERRGVYFRAGFLF